MIDAQTRALAEHVLAACRARGWTLATAESCTGGLVAGALTEIAGSSDVVDRGFVTYSNEAKMGVLGVNSDVLDTFGAVSIATAWAMAQGALKHSRADVAVAISGIAGPNGGSEQKPVGTVVFARALRDAPEGEDSEAEERRFADTTRAGVRLQAALVALELLLP